MDRLQLYDKACSLPLQSGVYIMHDKTGKIIYIGKAKRLRIRVSGYFRPGSEHEPKVERMIESAFDFDVIETDNEFEALVLECSLIKLHRPKYNILLKDDKGFSYIRVSDEEYPRITVSLQKYDDGARYIGPYTSSYAIKRMVETANTAFMLPICSRKFPESFGKARPCLNYHLKLCRAVCTGRVSKEEYMRDFNSALELVTKGTDTILDELRRRMQEASDVMEYERAARYRDSITAIERINDRQKIMGGAHSDCDVFAFAANESCVLAAVLKYRGGVLRDKEEHLIGETTDIAQARSELLAHYYINLPEIPKEILVDEDFEDRELVERMLSERRGSKVRLIVPLKGDTAAVVHMAYQNASDSLKRRYHRASREQASAAELAGALGLSSAPVRIESYDISNYGDDAVAGMVVFNNGKPAKSEYRRFKIKTVEGTDDYAAMREVLLRRIARYDDCMTNGSFARKPDLILLDGGAGHLGVVSRAMADTSFSDVPVFGMVKDDKHRTRDLVGLEGELSLSMNGNPFHFVAAIQNEVHRYSLEYRRTSHSKTAVRSSLLKIEGVGETTARLLMTRFKTIAAVKDATEQQLAEVKGIPQKTARHIYEYFHEEKDE